MGDPPGYPLPWCESFGAPYWQVNWFLVRMFDEWRQWQARKPMSEIIPVIDRHIAAAKQEGVGG